MGINRKLFFDSVRRDLFDGKLTAAHVAGLSAILTKWERDMPNADQRWLAYMLGTAHHETGRTLQPVRETFASSDAQAIARLDHAYAKGALTWVKTPYWHKDADGKSWLGRGFVQITHKANYQKLGSAIGIDLVGDPDRAMDLDVANKIMFTGMTNGLFTGRRLRNYFAGSAEDWRSARKIINGLERADLVASYAKSYYTAIRGTAA